MRHMPCPKCRTPTDANTKLFKSTDGTRIIWDCLGCQRRVDRPMSLAGIVAPDRKQAVLAEIVGQDTTPPVLATVAGSVTPEDSQTQCPPPRPTRKTRFFIILAVVVTAILATALFASFYPWLALLSAVALLAGGIAYTAWPPVFERIASLRSRPCPSLQRRIYIAAPIVLYGLILLALSQSQIRANWRGAEVRAEVAHEIENANAALEQEQVDEALRICDLLDSKANADEKTQLAAIRDRAEIIENTHRTEAANAKVRKLVSDGRTHVSMKEIDKAQSALETALDTPMATEFGRATELANKIVAARTKSANRFLDAGEFEKAKDQAQQAIRVPSATGTTEARRVITGICNGQVAALVASARDSLENMNREQAAVALESALDIRGATETAEAQKMFAAIREAREAEANARVSALMADAQRSIDANQLNDAIRTLNAALAVPHSTRSADVSAKIQAAQQQQVAKKEQIIARDKAEEARKAAAVAARKAEEEYEQNGLVLLRKTVEGRTGKFGGEITGIVINRRSRKLSYAQITFHLYDDSGAQVGTAIANINGLEAGGRWKFKATSLGTDFSKYKINELTGF